MLLLADGRFADNARSCDSESERLAPGIGSVGEHVPEIAGLLPVEFIEDHAARIDSILGSGIGRDGFVEAIRIVANENRLGRIDDSANIGKLGIIPNHLGSDPKNNSSLLSRGCGTVDFGACFLIAEKAKESNAGSQFALSVFLRDLDIGGCILPGTIRPQSAEKIADNSPLPRGQDEFLLGVFAFRMGEMLFEKPDNFISFFLSWIGSHIRKSAALSSAASSDLVLRSCPGQRAIGRTCQRSY